MTRDLAGRTALVTGVTSGIGRATAARLLERGAVVVGCARDADRLREVARDLPGLVTVPCDVRDRAERAALVDAVLTQSGRIDMLVSNAGVGYVGWVADMTADDVESVVTTNTTATIDLARLVLPGMLERGDGDILFLSSSAAWLSIPPLTVYCASKRGVDGFVEGLRREVTLRGVRVHSVNPGFVATEFMARALGVRPAEGDPGVQLSPGVDADRVARAAVGELERGRGRTVAVPRVMGLGRLVALPPVTHATDLVVKLGAGQLVRLGRRLALSRTPAAR